MVRKYRQRLEDKEGRLKNYEAKMSSLEVQLEDQDLERKANIILAGYFGEIGKMVEPYDEISLDGLKHRIGEMLKENQRLKHERDTANKQGSMFTREKELAEEFERILQKYN